MLSLLLILFFMGVGHTQEILIEGNLFDSKNKVPMPFTKISLLKILNGNSSNERLF